jgi:phosphoheptose isomerase
MTAIGTTSISRACLDMAMVFSTSGKSPNLIYALQAAREKQSMTVTFAGKDGGRFPEAADYCFIVPWFISEDCALRSFQEVRPAIEHRFDP